MKKIFSLILIVVSLNGLAQFPGVQSLSNPTTRLIVNGGLDARKGLINGLYADTTGANADQIDFYTGAQIYTRSDRNFWIRDTLPMRWTRIARFSEIGGTFTADNGLTMSTATNVQLGGTLTANTTITAGTNFFTIASSNTSRALYIANTSSGTALSLLSTTGSPFHATMNHTNTSSEFEMLGLDRQTSGTAANGIGTGLAFRIEGTNGSLVDANRFVARLTNATNATASSELDVMGIVSGVQDTMMNIQPAGIVRVNDNADTLATKAYARSVGGAGGSGDVTKVGTPVNNQVGVWTGDGTIEGDADFTFDGTAVTTRLKSRVGSTASSATPTINTDVTDIYKLTALTTDITSFTTNLSGTPDDGDVLQIQITGTASRAIAWGASFVNSTVIMPTSTSGTITLTVTFEYFTTSSYGNNKWVCGGYF